MSGDARPIGPLISADPHLLARTRGRPRLAVRLRELVRPRPLRRAAM